MDDKFSIPPNNWTSKILGVIDGMVASVISIQRVL